MAPNSQSLRDGSRDVSGLLVLAVVLRLSGLFQGYQFWLKGPFVTLSADERSVSHNVSVYLQNGQVIRSNYVFGFIRELLLWFHPLSLFHVEPTALHLLLATRTMNIAFGAATVALTYWWARLLFNDRLAALLSALFLAFSPLHVIQSHYATPLASCIFWAYACFFTCLAHLKGKHSSATLLLAFFCGAAAIAVKYFFAVIVPLIYVLFVSRKSIWTKAMAVALFVATALYFNYWYTPRALYPGIKQDFLTLNLHERLHHRWLNPFIYGMDLVLGMGLPSLVIAGIGVVSLRRNGFYDVRTTLHRIFCLDVPLLCYLASICTLTSCFSRHATPLLPYLSLAAGWMLARFIRQNTAVPHRRAALALLAVLGLYQAMSVAWIERQHLICRPYLAAQWFRENLKEGEKIYVPSRSEQWLWFEDVIPVSLFTPTRSAAAYILTPQVAMWRFGRTPFYPLTAHPKDEEIYQTYNVEDIPFLWKLIEGKTEFKKAISFEATEIIPEFWLYRKIFRMSLDLSYGDVVIYKRVS